MKMAQATRTFWSQAEALEFITEKQKNDNSVNDRFLLMIDRKTSFVFFLCQEEILYLFSFESQPEGKRRYQVADIDVFIDEYQ